MMRRWKSGWILLVVAAVLYMLMEWTPVDTYIAAVKRQQAIYAAANHTAEEESADALLKRIMSGAGERYEAPIDARVDRVWKAIPGYNGLEVDVERTLANNRGVHPDEELQWFYREIEPKVQLEDLGAQPVYKGNPMKKMVGLMINVAWGDEYLPGMLETLRKENVHATFFFDGSWLSKNIETAREICEDGYRFECSNHAYSHPNMSELNRSRQTEEIAKTERLLREELGIDNRWFAPPSGDYNEMTVDVAYEIGLGTVLWTIDTVDWKKPDPSWIVRRVASGLEPGSLILMHPTSSSSQALYDLIAVILEQQYVFGIVSEVLSSKRVSNIEEVLDF